MEIKFSKYEGAGNDFILLDNRKGDFKEQANTALIKKLCDRHFGIGGDGLMILKESEGYDFEMLYYNADGNLGSMCGNGGRCITAFARHLGVIGKETNFLAVDGPHYAKISEKGDWVSLEMIEVDRIEKNGDAFILNTGSPHYVLQVTDLASKDVFADGKAIRYNDTYKKEGININFVEDMGDHYFVRTYERGVEDETFACGTGVTAVAMAMVKQKNQTGDIKTSLVVPGGKLSVSFNYDGSKFTNVFLDGPATFVFGGAVDV